MLSIFTYLSKHQFFIRQRVSHSKPRVAGYFGNTRESYRAIAIVISLCWIIANTAQAQPKPEQSREDKTETKHDSGWPEKLGPAEIQTGAGTIRLAFTAQLLATDLNKDMGKGKERDNSFEVEPRRIRWYLKSRFLDDRLKVELQINTVPKSLEILDFWGQYHLLDQVQIRLGQTKEPFTRYRQQSFSSSLLAEWANETQYFGADRQLGLMLHNSDAKPRFEYALAIFSGQNLRKSQAVEVANAIYCEKIPSASFLPRESSISVDEWHPEIELRVQHNSPDADPYNPSDAERTGFRHVESLSVAWDNVANLHTVGGRDIDRAVGQEATRDMMLRLSPEVLLKAYGLSVIANFYLGVSRMTQSAENDLAMLGVVAETAYRFDRFWEIAARFSRVDFSGELRRDAADRAAAIIDAEENDAAREALANQYRNAGVLKADQEVTLGLTVYVVGNDLKWQTDASWLRQYRESDDRDDYRARTQMQVGF
ncbi:MAG: hypothetical protein JXA30_00010 [Deltaproteobacteria bacterium]|nr:hypothetical protein [Deltaproteobacteria bacterium]